MGCLIVLFGSSIANGDIWIYITQIVSCIPWWYLTFEGCIGLLIKSFLEFGFGLSQSNLKEMQIIYSCLPSIEMDNCLIEGFITVWTPTILFLNMCHGWEDEMSNIAFLFTYVGWLGVCAGAIVRLGALLENLRQIPRHTRRRSKPKCKMKRRHKYLLYKRNEHRKRAKLKAK